MDKKKKKNKQAFGELGQQVQVEFENHYLDALKEKKLAIFALLAFLAMVVLTYVFWVNTHQPEAVYDTKDSLQEPPVASSSDVNTIETEATKALVASKEEFVFDWTLADYDHLVIGMKSDATGDSLTDVMRKFGKASVAWLSNEAGDYLKLEYSPDNSNLEPGEFYDNRSVQLFFYKNGKEYYLQQKSALLVNDTFPVLDTVTEFPWTEDNFRKILVGNANTGAGGSSYDEVIDLGGLPKEVIITAYQAYLSERKEIRLVYSYQKKSASILLTEQEDGTYRVHAKIGEF